MGNTEFKKKKGFGAKWVWVVVPLIAAIVAIAVSSKTSSKISLFGVIGKACQCTRGTPKYSGMVEDCCCDYETVDNLNKELLYPSLQELVKTPFFRVNPLGLVHWYWLGTWECAPLE
ncbi:endoplasmic oxidoreductin-1-like protein, partial [Trifolium pratense]